METAVKNEKMLLRDTHFGIRAMRASKMKVTFRDSTYWNDTGTGSVPSDERRVLISAQGAYYIAVFDRAKALFRVEDELLETVFRTGSQNVYWRELTPEVK